MGLLGSQTAFVLILKQEEELSRRVAANQSSKAAKRNRKPEPSVAHSLPWQQPALGSP